MKKTKLIWLIVAIVVIIAVVFGIYWFIFRSAEKIVFVRSGDIWLMNPDGTGQKQITLEAEKGRYSYSPVISSSGRYIVFVRADNLWQVSVNGKNQKQITSYQEPERCLHPAFSPDGKRVVFSLITEQGQDIWTVNVDGADARRLTSDGLGNDYPNFTPDGKEIVCSAVQEFEGVALPQIYIMNADGSNQRALTKDTAVRFVDSVVSPKGEKILFWSKGLRTTNLESGGLGQSLYLMNKDGSNVEKIERSRPSQDKIPENFLAAVPDNPELVLTNILQDRLPDWSSNGKKIVFTSSYGDDKICEDGTDIFVMDMETKGVTRLTNDCSSGQAIWGKVK